MKTISVVAAVIVYNGQFLCVQRGLSKYEYINHKYEFPGGKVETNETEEEALVREISEELKIEIQVNEKLITVEHMYPDFKIVMAAYFCRALTSQITLTEHVDSQWLFVPDMMNLDWAAADLPIVEKLLELQGLHWDKQV